MDLNVLKNGFISRPTGTPAIEKNFIGNKKLLSQGQNSKTLS